MTATLTRKVYDDFIENKIKIKWKLVKFELFLNDIIDITINILMQKQINHIEYLPSLSFLQKDHQKLIEDLKIDFNYNN